MPDKNGATGVTEGNSTGQLESVMDEWTGKFSQLGSEVGEYIRSSACLAEKSFERLREIDLHDVSEQARNRLRENPGTTLIASAAAGLLIGIVLRAAVK